MRTRRPAGCRGLRNDAAGALRGGDTRAVLRHRLAGLRRATVSAGCAGRAHAPVQQLHGQILAAIGVQAFVLTVKSPGELRGEPRSGRAGGYGHRDLVNLARVAGIDKALKANVPVGEAVLAEPVQRRALELAQPHMHRLDVEESES